MAESLVVGVAGNPNSGKTSLFNALTGANLKVGNWPGVTVEKREGRVTRDGCTFRFVDIPGTYGLSARSVDERIAIEFLTKEQPDVVLVVMDAANFNRNFYLFTLIAEMGLPVVGVLNMADVAERRGVEIDREDMEAHLGVPFVRTVASRSIGVNDVWACLLSRRYGHMKQLPQYPKQIEEAIRTMMQPPLSAPSRFHALGMLDGSLVDEHLNESHTRLVAEIRAGVEQEPDSDTELDEEIAEKRYEFVYTVGRMFVRKRLTHRERVAWTDRIDRFVTNRFLGIPIFLTVMWLMFAAVFTFGNPIADGVDGLFGWLASHIGGTGLLASFFRDGLISGVGAVLVFVPNIFILFLVIAVMEDTGYMARAAFVADRFMHALGLHGKSFIPMLLGFGCNIPAMMAVRTMESEKDRILTGLTIPYMSCSARLPVYLLFAGAFFPTHRAQVVFALYLLGILVAIVVARVLKRILFSGEVSPLIMELPAYHVPSLRLVLRSAWMRTGHFVRKAGTFILGTVVLVWLLASLPAGAEYASAQTWIGRLGAVIAPVLKPAGFASWQAAVALVFGFMAKEVVIGTLGALYGGEGALAMALHGSFTPLSSLSFLVMVLLYIPCVATIAVMRRELGTKWALISTGLSLVLGYGFAVVVYQVGSLLGLG